MNLFSKGLSNIQEMKVNNKFTTLNPNAAEFVPSTFKTSLEHTKNGDVARTDIPGASAKAILDRTESDISNKSDDEVHQYWRLQLPDDITPDFKFSGEGEDETAKPGLSLAGLSIHDGDGTLSLSSSGGQLLNRTIGISPRNNEDISLIEKMRYSGPVHSPNHSSASLLNLASNPWDKRFNSDQHLSDGRERHYFNGNSSSGSFSDLPIDPAVLEDIDAKHMEYLTSQFPGFSAESLADVYYANQCNLSPTIDMLSQLELQVDEGFNQNLYPKTFSAPRHTALDFAALPVPDAQNGLSKSHPSGMSRGVPDFASAVRKLASQNSHWKYERNGSADANIGSSRSQQLLASSYSGQGRSFYGDKSQRYNSDRTSPFWLDTGDSVENLYSESREEARDLACLRNTCFEQATQAFQMGNNALAKELSNKGKFYSIQMDAAHEKAREFIYRQRNPVTSELSYGQGLERKIDLHGLHVNEAIHLLKHELSVIRNTARSSGQILHLSIYVGTGHLTKVSRIPARLPIAVEQFLIEEGFQYSEPQPGLLRVVIY
ncbi:hypothetical protein QJS10_CPB12g01803 [Acorus calamus]|uniref:Smr domain-containing protein n=1 Tax=Acorus calamus TaxID=4465 RepID=A0AAV9DLJ7_ACOCL|nr:hypothetical protein QJS10_CPB12g01803 [Acorus calamus]